MEWLLNWLKANWQIPLEVLILAAVVYLILKTLRGSRGAGILRGILIVFTIVFVAVSLLTRYSRLNVINYLLQQFLTLFAFVLIIVFQPELRRGLIRLGERPFIRKMFRRESAVMREVADAVRRMAENRVGALITFEREIGLKPYIEGGTRLDAEVTSELLNTIFWPGSPLHDGAVIISEQRVVAAGCLFPLSDKPGLSKMMGTRHRAGIGVTEESDAVSIIVSEETGRVSLAVAGRIEENVGLENLSARLTDLVTREAKGVAKRNADVANHSG
jgi:diadenylate cyclase